MPQFLHTPIDKLTIEDVQQFVNSKPVETDQLEFKSLFNPQTRECVWKAGTDVANQVKKDIVKEIVAFANAHGGQLLVGVSETKSKPHSADSITPIPDCDDFAERLRRIVDASVTPPLASFQSDGLRFDDGSGVVLVRVGRSRNAPHRSEIDKNCYIRRVDSSVPMTMREIQDLTLNTARGLEEVERRLVQCRAAFSQKGHGLSNQKNVCVMGLGLAAIPTDSSVYVESVHGNREVAPLWNVFSADLCGRKTDLLSFSGFDSTRPILRGALMTWKGRAGIAEVSVNCSGVVTFASFNYANDNHTAFEFWVEWPIGAAANVMAMVDRFRLAAGSPAVEYALQMFITAFAPSESEEIGKVVVANPGDIIDEKPIEPIPLEPPNYSLGHRDDFDSVLTMIYKDIYNSAGYHINRQREVRVFSLEMG